MEKSQQICIEKHLSDLITYTVCHDALLSYMQEKEVLDFADVDIIHAIREESNQALKFYEIIKTRRNAYPILLEGLRKTNQHEITELLNTGELPRTLNKRKRLEQLFGASKNPILFNVRPPDQLFSGRKNELESLHEKVNRIIRNPYRDDLPLAVMITGLGGIGKTTLCRKYIQLHQRNFEDTIIWINAENEMSLTQCFTKLAKDELKISTKNANGQEKDISMVVNDVYKQLEERVSLFVFDNVERGPYLRKFLPFDRIYPANCTRPVVLMTSRDAEWDASVEKIQLGVLTQDDAVAMVNKGLQWEDMATEESIIKLVKSLQYFPLAIHQAIAFIREQNQGHSLDYSVENYLQDYEQNQREMLSFKDSPFCTQLTNDYSWTTFTTWRVTMQKFQRETSHRKPFPFKRPLGKIEMVGKLAVKVLEYMAYIQADNISITTLQLLAGKNNDTDIFKKALRLLVKYSMIAQNEEKNVFNLHRLVQEVTRINLALLNRKHELLCKIVKSFSAELKNENVDHAVVTWKYLDVSLQQKFLQFPFIIIRKMQMTSRNLESFNFGKSARDDILKIEESPGITLCYLRRENKKKANVLMDINLNLCASICASGRSMEALEWLENVCENELNNNKFTVKTPKDQNVFRAFLQKGRCLLSLGKFEEAMIYLEKAREGFLRLKNGKKVSEIEYYIARLYGNKGTERSIKLCIEMLWNLRESLKSSDDYEELLGLVAGHLGWYVSRQGHLEEARKILEENLERDNRGCADNGSVSTTSSYLADIYTMEGKFEQALEIHEQVYKKRVELYGMLESDTLVAKQSVAVDLFWLGRHSESLKYFEEIYNCKKEVFGMDENHRTVIYTREWIADSLVELDELEQALDVYRDVFNRRSQTLGMDNLKTKQAFEKIQKLTERMSN